MTGDDVFLGLMREEVARAREKFPRNTLMFVALAEEFGELANALIEFRLGKATAAHVLEEAVQTAVMAMRVAIDGDSSIGEGPIDELRHAWHGWKTILDEQEESS